MTFCGHPYVDIRASFNSFIPASISDSLTERLVDFYMNWLKKNPHLHDKVEFDVVPTCYSFDFEKWMSRFTAEKLFSKKEIHDLGEALKNITRLAFNRNDQDLKSIATLEKRYHNIMAKEMNPLTRAITLLEDCRRYGTPAFSHLARSAFIGVSLVNSAVDEGIIPKAAMDCFFSSIHTIAHEFTDAVKEVSEGTLKWAIFEKKFGHLRPGTYDITSQCYSENAEYFLRPLIKNSKRNSPIRKDISLWMNAKSNFSEALIKAELSLDIDQVETFIREAIEGREYAKFIFTRNLSQALNCLIDYGKNYNLSRDDLANISLDSFISLRNESVSASDIAKFLRQNYENGQKEQNLAKKVELPPLIFSNNDFDYFMYPTNKPNFIGSGHVTAECIVMQNMKSHEIKDIKGCIVIIPHADPGYDWIFAKGVIGLITMWGGVNSHIAIRAAEFGIPAAIGIGEIEFNRISTSSIIELNAGNHLIKIIR